MDSINNINELPKKTIVHATLKRQNITIVFCTDDNYFVYIICHYSKNGKVVHQETIIDADMKGRINALVRNGYIQKEKKMVRTTLRN